MLKNILFVLLFSINSFATTDLGKELQLGINPQDGHYQLGVHYSYDSGATGDKFDITWGILFGTTLSQQELSSLPNQIKWNVFNLKTQTYFSDWSTQPTISGKDLLLTSVSAEGDFAKSIISNHVSVILVFSDLSGKPIYHLNLGKLCKTLPTYFSNLTEAEKLCHQVTVNDVEKEQKLFCDDKKTELLGYVKKGLLKCEIADKKFQSFGCGPLKCN